MQGNIKFKLISYENFLKCTQRTEMLKASICIKLGWIYLKLRTKKKEIIMIQD